MGFEKYSKPSKKTEEDKTLKTPIKYQKINEDDKYGANIAIIGPATFGKSLMSAAFGFFNSTYVSKLDKTKFPYSIELLKEGHMPEVERIIIHDVDNNFKKSMSRSTFKTILKPLIPIIEVVEFDIPERDIEVQNGKAVSVRFDELLKSRREIEDAAKEAVKDFGPETLWIVDSLSEYYQVLDSMFSIVYEVMYGKAASTGIENQKDWQIRNAWWTEYMKRKRKYQGWQLDTVKAVEIPPHWRKNARTKADPYNIKWAEGSGGNIFNLDQVYRMFQDDAGLPYLNLIDGRYKSKIASENMKMYYQYDKRDIAFNIIEHIAEHIITGSDLREEDLW